MTGNPTYFTAGMYMDPANGGWFDQLNQPHPVSPGGVPANPGYLAISGSNAAGVISLPAPPAGYAWLLTGIYWSYSDTPTGGNLTVNDGSDQFDIDITTSGPGFVMFNTGFIFATSQAVTITIHAGGGSVVGKVGLIGARQIPVTAGHGGSGFPSPSSVIIVPGI